MKLAFRNIPIHLVVAGSGWLSRLVTAGVGILSIRVLMGSLGTERYAVYAIFGGLQGWYLLADLGTGFSLQNHISERRARNEDYAPFVSATAVMAGLLFLATTALLYLAAPWLATLLLKGFPLLSETQKVRDFLLVGGLSIMAAIAGIAYKVWFAEQKGYLANLVPAVAAVIGFGGVVTVARSGLEDKLFWSLLATFGPLALLSLASFALQLRRLFSPKGVWCREVLRPLLVRALKFWGFALMAAGVLQVDYLLMSQFLPAEEIVVYNLSTKVFALVFFIYSALLTAVWPVLAEAVTVNDWATVKGHLRRYLLLGAVLMTLFAAIFTVFRTEIVHLLAPGKVLAIPGLFIVLLGAYHLVRVWTDIFTVALQSMSYLRPFYLYVPIQALFSILFQWLLIPRLGIYGVVLGLMVSFFLTANWFLPFSFLRRMNRIQGEVSLEERSL